MLERSAELSALEDFVAAAATGRGGAAAIIGPAGIGKTSLLGAARELASRAGLDVLSARGGELERDFPYGVARQLLERPLAALGPAERDAVLGGAAAPARLVLGLGASDAADALFTVVHGLYWTCANLAARGPLLVVVDDAHWADAASLRFLAYLARRVEDLPLGLLVAARPGVAAADEGSLRAVTEGPDVRALQPAPLSREAVAELVGAPDGLARACHAATGGNPFLCRALMAALEDLGPPEGADLAELAGRAVSAVVMDRLGRLPPAAARVAQAVAVLGTDAGLRQAAALAGLDEDTAAAAADELAARDILRVGRPLEFVHPLVRAAVAERLPPAATRLSHARAARLLGGTGAPADRVAAHLLAADPAGDPWAVERLAEAAALAEARGAPDAAVSFLRRALEEPPPPGPRLELLHRLGLAELHAGATTDALAHLEEAARHATDAAARAAMTRDLVAVLVVRGEYARAAEVILAAVDRAAELDADAIAGLHGLLLQIATQEPAACPGVDARVPALDDAALDGATPGARQYLAAYSTHAAVRLSPASTVLAAAERAEAAGVGAELTSGAMAWTNTIYPAIFAEADELAEHLLDDAFDRLAQTPSAVGTTRAYAARSMLHLVHGALREAQADARVAIRTGRQAGLYVRALAVSTLVEALVDQGDLDTAEAALAEEGHDGDVSDTFLHSWVLHARGRLRLAQNRIDAALADLETLLARGEQRGLRNPGLKAHRSTLALTLLRAGDADRAATLAREELELARIWGTRRAVGVALRTVGMTGGGVEALEESVDELAGTRSRLEHARSLVELGAALRRAGRRSDAREPLHEGMELAHACAAAPLVARAREELVATGSRPRRILRTGVDALTASELRVARMAADGMGNREIAQALFVTLRTVELHLTHAYQKLGVTGREELGPALAGAGGARGAAVLGA